MKKRLFKSLLVVAVMLVAMATPSFAQFQNFENKTHTPEAQPFADLSQKIWDLMAQKDADSLKEIFHPNAMFVHMGGYWGTEQELATIGGGFIYYKQADVYGVDVKQINEDNWAVYSTIVLTAELGGNDVITPFFVTQTFTRENDKWLLTAFVFTTRMGGPGADRANH
ncbi:MAG: nuclear transport factor 2 family protein [Bacteroidaceae bacterium]|nr:nuclear transport factor 2 family protein [Bacteroidaceae bacterium]